MTIGVEGVNIAKEHKVFIVPSVANLEADSGAIGVYNNTADYICVCNKGVSVTTAKTKHGITKHRIAHTVCHRITRNTYCSAEQEVTLSINVYVYFTSYRSEHKTKVYKVFSYVWVLEVKHLREYE